MSLPVDVTLTDGHKISRKQNLLGSFFSGNSHLIRMKLDLWSYSNWIKGNNIQAESREIIADLLSVSKSFNIGMHLDIREAISFPEVVYSYAKVNDLDLYLRSQGQERVKNDLPVTLTFIWGHNGKRE